MNKNFKGNNNEPNLRKSSKHKDRNIHKVNTIRERPKRDTTLRKNNKNLRKKNKPRF